MTNYTSSDISLEMLRSNKWPERMKHGRLGVVSVAVENLRPHAPVEAVIVPPSQEVTDYQTRVEAPAVIEAAEEITRRAADTNELTVERLIDTAKNYASGDGNPIIEEALRNAQETP